MKRERKRKKNGKKEKSEATPFWRPVLRNPDKQTFNATPTNYEREEHTLEIGLRHLLPIQLAIQEKCAKLVQKHFRDLRVISPQNCVKIVRAQLLHNFCAKNGAHAQFLHNFSEPPATQAGCVLRTISAQLSQPGAIFLKSAAVQDRDVSKIGL